MGPRRTADVAFLAEMHDGVGPCGRRRPGAAGFVAGNLAHQLLVAGHDRVAVAGAPLVGSAARVGRQRCGGQQNRDRRRRHEQMIFHIRSFLGRRAVDNRSPTPATQVGGGSYASNLPATIRPGFL